jgi:hypothetical protein
MKTPVLLVKIMPKSLKVEGEFDSEVTAKEAVKDMPGTYVLLPCIQNEEPEPEPEPNQE